MSSNYPDGVSDRDIDREFGEEYDSEREWRELREEQMIDDYRDMMIERERALEGYNS